MTLGLGWWGVWALLSLLTILWFLGVFDGRDDNK
jgi:hypothetical protein